jgi:hypothetical protein
MKRFKIIILGFALLILLGSVGCNNERCYHCYQFGASFLAVKGSDTVFVGILNKNAVQDSVNHYIGLGFTVGTPNGGYSPNPSNGALTCGAINNSGAPYPDSCVLVEK